MEIIPKTISEMYISIPSDPIELKLCCLRTVINRFLLVLLIIEEILTTPAIYRRYERLKQMLKGQAVREVGGGVATLGEAII